MPTDALISQSLSSLINGISRQPAQARLPSQAEAQVNVVSDVAAGATRRPPLEHLALLSGPLAGSTPAGGYAFHTIDRGAGERFSVVVEDGDINVYDLSDGSEVVVNDNADGSVGSYTYLDYDTSATTAEDAFTLVTVADYTFVVNNTLATAMSGSTSTARTHAHEFLFVARNGAPTSTENVATIFFDGTGISGAGSNQASASLAQAMIDALTGGSGVAIGVPTAGTAPADNWTFTLVTDNLIHGYQDDVSGGLESITASDDYGDTIHRLLTTGTGGEEPRIRQFSELPAVGVDDFVVKVQGDDGNEEDDFYVKYSTEEHSWQETKKNGLDDSFDANTMPHALVYDTGTGEFSFEPLTYAARGVGDTISAPEPSFVGKPITDVTVHKNRLTFLSDENSIGSESGEFFNFWPTTVTTLVDSDPIDVAGTGDRVATWDFALPFRGNLTLFSATGSLVGELLGSRDANLTVANARIAERGSYGISPVRPVAVGDSLYFILDRGGRTSLLQYSERDVELFEADEVTSHVADYLPANIFKLAASRAENMICALSSDADEDHKVYVYRFFTLGSEQVMTSWSEWEFTADDQILTADWIESTLYLLISRQDGVHLEKIDFGKNDEDLGAYATNLGYRVHLDSLVYVSGTYDSPTDTTTWVLPYDQATNGGVYRGVKGGEWGASRGSLIAGFEYATDQLVSAVGDLSAFPIYVGREYTSTYELSEVVLRGGGTVDSAKGARIGGRLQLRKGRVVYSDTGTFTARILSREDDFEYETTFTPLFFDQAVFGVAGLADGVFTFDIGSDARNARIIFYSNSFLPFTLANAEWEGRYFQRSTQA